MDILGTLAEKLFPPSCAVVIVAAGSSQRMAGLDKIMAPLNGKPVILRSALAFEKNDYVKEIIVVTRPEIRAEVEKLLTDSGITKLKAVCDGGDTRSASVLKGVNWVSKKYKLIAVHDGARPLVSQRIINDAVHMAAKTKAAVPAIPVADTIRTVEGGLCVDTPDRAKLYAMQTPQIFDADLLRAALVHTISKKLPVTDDCSALESIGMCSSIVEGEQENLKITTRLDFALANAIARRRDAE